MRTVLEWPQSHAPSKYYAYEPQQRLLIRFVMKPDAK